MSQKVYKALEKIHLPSSDREQEFIRVLHPGALIYYYGKEPWINIQTEVFETIWKEDFNVIVDRLEEIPLTDEMNIKGNVLRYIAVHNWKNKLTESINRLSFMELIIQCNPHLK